MFPRFNLVLMVNHACNLRCTYCYTGAKFSRSMDPAIGRKAIDRALASLAPEGELELGFFGGEPLAEARLISALIDHARRRADESGAGLRLTLTTNGTVAGPDAWAVLTRPDLDLFVSHDGLPEIHDRHRIGADGRGTSAAVEATMRRLGDAGKSFGVILVVRPDTVDALPAGLERLHSLGVRQFVPSLDLWTRWSSADGPRLEAAIVGAAERWRAWLPETRISWFDEKVARLSRVPLEESSRCGFGAGEIAVAPSGRLYPCERLIGEDADDNPMRLPGHASQGDDFRPEKIFADRSAEPCGRCALQSICSTTCRCSNYVRTGDVRTPDGLLCLFDQVCVRETARAMAAWHANAEIQEAAHV